MILGEGLALYGFIFIITIPIYAIYSLIKYIKRKVENRNVNRLLREVHAQNEEIQKHQRLCAQHTADILRLRDAIKNSNDRAERQHLCEQLNTLLDSN